MKQRETFHLFDLVFKCLMGLSDTAIIHFINGLFSTNHPLSSSLTRPNIESVNTSLNRSLADIIFLINDTFSYHIEAQLSPDKNLVVRIFRYIMDTSEKLAVQEGNILHVRFSDVRVIYWKITRNTPDKEIISFEFPGGARYEYEIPSFKFPQYTPAMLEEQGLGILLPFCMVKQQDNVKNARSEEEREVLAKQISAEVQEVWEAARKSEAGGKMNAGDMKNVLRLTERMYNELYSGYKEFEEEQKMWEDIKLIDYEGLERKIEKAEKARKAALRQKRKAIREKEEAARKLRAMGISDELLAAAGLLNTAGK